MDWRNLIRPDLGKKAYRLRCRFRCEMGDHKPGGKDRAYFEEARKVALEQFVSDMRVRGWEYTDRELPRVTGPYPYIPAGELPKPRRISARNMLSGVMQGQKFRDDVEGVFTPDPVDATEYVEYEIAAVFVRNTILVDLPDLHEEKRPTW